MKVIIPALAALCAQGALTVPHGHSHKQLHAQKRDDNVVDQTVTDVVTVTNPEPVAIVWVDGNGVPVSTEYPSGQTSPTPAPAPASSASPTSDAEPSPSPAPPAPADGDTPSASSAAPLFEPPAPAPSSPAAPASAPSSEATSNAAGAKWASQSGQGQGQGQGQGGTGQSTGSSSSGVNGYGLCYDLIDDSSQCKSQSTVSSDLAFFKSQGFGIVRTYDIGCNLGNLVSAASSQGMKVMIGINNINNVVGDLGKLVSFVNGNWGPVDTVNIGNEVVNNGQGTPAQVVAALGTARGILSAAGYTGNVVAVEVFNQMIANPSICAASDYCAANAHGYFDADLQAGNDGQWLQSTIQQISAANGGKRVVITESGWPWSGNPNGAAVANTGNQQAAVDSLKDAFSSDPSSLFIFQAYDATYKSPGSWGIEQSFGIFGH